MATEHTKRPSATKSGPGRYHSDGHKRATVKAPKGAPAGFVQHTNPKANARRSVKSEIGARQYRKQVKALAALARA